VIGAPGSVHRDGAAKFGRHHDNGIAPGRAKLLLQGSDPAIELGQAARKQALHRLLVGVGVPAAQFQNRCHWPVRPLQKFRGGLGKADKGASGSRRAGLAGQHIGFPWRRPAALAIAASRAL
jgi:hypothetical protein